MLFTLRGVQPADLIAAAMTDAPTTRQSGRRRLLQTDDVSSVFGIELDAGDGSAGDTAPRRAPDLNKPLTNETPPKPTPTKKTTTTRRGGRTQQAGFAGQGDQEERILQIDGQEVHRGEDKGLHQGADQRRGPGQGQREAEGVLEGSAQEVEDGSVIVGASVINCW